MSLIKVNVLFLHRSNQWCGYWRVCVYCTHQTEMFDIDIKTIEHVKKWDVIKKDYRLQE